MEVVQTLQAIYQDKVTAVHSFISDWWEQKLQIDQDHNQAERAQLRNIQREVEATSVVMTRLLKTFSDEYHGRTSIVKSYIKEFASQVKAFRRKSTDNVEEKAVAKEVDALLQRVENSMKIEFARYQSIAADLYRSIQVRVRGIEDCLLSQRKVILEKAKVKTIVVNPYTYSDINKLDQLILAEVRSRTLLNSELQEGITMLAREEFRILSSFRDNLQSLATTYPQKFNDNFLYPAMLADLKKMLERDDIFRLKYYSPTGVEDMKGETEIEGARNIFKLITENVEQRLTDRINFQKVYSYFLDQLSCKRWPLQLLADDKNEEWESCTGAVLISGSFLLIGRLRELIEQYDIARTIFKKESGLTVRLEQTDKPRGIRRLFKSGKTHNDLIRFQSEQELEVFELHCTRRI